MFLSIRVEVEISTVLCLREANGEALEEIVLAMRLNVELCDASEKVEKLEYRPGSFPP